MFKESKCLYSEFSPVIWKLALKVIIFYRLIRIIMYFFLFSKVNEHITNWMYFYKPSILLTALVFLDLPSKWLWLILTRDIWLTKYCCLQRFPRQLHQFSWLQSKVSLNSQLTSLPGMSHVCSKKRSTKTSCHRLTWMGWWRGGCISQKDARGR